eukprot:1979711-Prorocentrum_lima.AAC.1
MSGHGILEPFPAAAGPPLDLRVGLVMTVPEHLRDRIADRARSNLHWPGMRSRSAGFRRPLARLLHLAQYQISTDGSSDVSMRAVATLVRSLAHGYE